MRGGWPWPALGGAAGRRLGEWLSGGGEGATEGVGGAARAWLALESMRLGPGTTVAVAESMRALEELWQDAVSLAGGERGAGWRLVKVPALHGEGVKRVSGAVRAEAVGERLDALRACWERRREEAGGGRGKGEKWLVATCVQALLEEAPDPGALEAATLRVEVGGEMDPEALCERLSDGGYGFEAEVLARGQASRRGGVVDVWPPGDEWPLRVEFFGDSIEGLRRFDPGTQRSVEKVARAELPPAAERCGAAGGGVAAATAYLPEGAAWAWLDPDGLLGHFAMSEELSRGGARRDGEESVWHAFTEWRAGIAKGFRGGQVDVGGDAGTGGFRAAAAGAEGVLKLGVSGADGLGDLAGRAVPADALEREREGLLSRWRERVAGGWRLVVWVGTEAAGERFRKTWEEKGGGQEGVEVRLGGLSEGFVLRGRKWGALGEGDLYGSRREGARRRRERGGAARDATGERLGDWTDLRPGEYVVHALHGIGKYLGMYEIRFEGALQEALAVEYEGGARLYVPTGQVHLLSRYVGIGHGRPALHALGGKRWQKEKEAAERAAHDLAAQMLETQARRQAMGGFAFPPDGEWQAAFEATFPHVETADQLAAVEEVKRDMESAKPMDRLLCGDAGYGKTEVAMRAAFKAVEGGKQVAVLVPTTVLAQQHYETFAGRMGRWPVTVEVVSRFRSAAAQRETLARAALGKVDVLIGTHRLLQKDVKFADLGLVIIDEEQRFGVAAKERLKRMKQGVDVLTLSATPIPRTLYLSLTGARDLSLIQTPPRERLPIETFVAQDTDELVREAVLNELNRGGQVFFLHNRVQSIGAVRRRLERLVPGVRVGVGHGQMGEKSLADVMRAFIRRETDVLLCTTIVESGVDIPNVNTILIDRSDRFGMADLYQLRGRVGRSRQQAYAYLLLPRHGLLFGAARERIGALRKHAGLGAGYKLALRDLEIRGAGNVLGAEQSGHIAAVGFDLYCQLLERTVARLKGEAPRPVIETRTDFDFLRMTPDPAEAERAAVIPADFIEDENVRIGLYRSLAGVALEGEAEALEEEWRDRFGELPGPMKRLLALARIRVLGAGLGVKEMRTDGDRLMLSKGGGQWIMPGGRHIRLHKHGADERLAEIEKRLGQLARGGGGGAG